MGRNLVGSCGLLIAIGLAGYPARAGDRKSARRVQEAVEEVLIAPKGSAISPRYEMAGASTGKPFEARSSVLRITDRAGTGVREDAAAPASEHKQLTVFHFDSKFGDIAVQPVIGHVNGAQFSLGF